MCVFPSYRPVKFRSVNATIQTTHMVFKCGHCFECSAERKRDYMIRSYVETCYTLAQDGIVLVDTLTYNDNHVPFILVDSDVKFSLEERAHLTKARHYDVSLWNLRNPDDVKVWSKNLYRVNCFDYTHVQKFFKRFRLYCCNYLREKAGLSHSTPKGKPIDKYVSGHLRYFLSPEFGHVRGRPHYHLTIYSTVNGLSKLQLKELFDSAWRRLNFRVMSHRFIEYNSDDLGATEGYERLEYNTIKSVSEIAHIKYQTKYVCKDSYMEQLYCKLFGVSSPSHLPHCLHTEIRCSIGFGSQLIDDYLDLFCDLNSTVYLDLDKEKVFVPHSESDGQNVFGNKACYNLPQYYIRKLYYRRVRLNDGTYTTCLNENGVRRNVKRFNEKISSCVESMKVHIASLPDDLFQEWRTLIDGRSLVELAQYKLLFYGKSLNFSFWDGSIETYYRNLAYTKVVTFNILEKSHAQYKKTFFDCHPYSNDEVILDLQLHNCLDFLNRTRFSFSSWKNAEYVRQHKYDKFYKKVLKIK